MDEDKMNDTTNIHTNDEDELISIDTSRKKKEKINNFIKFL